MISIIIPAHNEQKTIGRLLDKLTGYNGVELIVVDGASTDNTKQVLDNYQIKVISSKKLRSYQCNEGAKEARGDILVFLHADCFLDEEALKEIKYSIEEGFIGGALRQGINSDKLVYRFIELSGNIRAKLSKIFYGDQAIFVKKDTFFKIGGFDEIELFDDVAFSRKLKRAGKTCLLNNKVYTSCRRWENQGIIKTTILNWVLTIGFLLRVSPKVLKNIYYDVR